MQAMALQVLFLCRFIFGRQFRGPDGTESPERRSLGIPSRGCGAQQAPGGLECLGFCVRTCRDSRKSPQKVMVFSEAIGVAIAHFLKIESAGVAFLNG